MASTIAGNKPCPRYTGAPPCPVRYYVWTAQSILTHSKRKGCNHDVNTKIHHTTGHVIISLRYDFIRHCGR